MLSLQLESPRYRVAEGLNFLVTVFIERHLNGGILCIQNLHVLDKFVRIFFSGLSAFKASTLLSDFQSGSVIKMKDVPSILSKASQMRLSAFMPMDKDTSICSCGKCVAEARQVLAANMVVILTHKGCYFDIDAWRKAPGQSHTTLIKKKWSLLHVELERPVMAEAVTEDMGVGYFFEGGLTETTSVL